jgi:hypothetical protein
LISPFNRDRDAVAKGNDGIYDNIRALQREIGGLALAEDRRWKDRRIRDVSIDRVESVVRGQQIVGDQNHGLRRAIVEIALATQRLLRRERGSREARRHEPDLERLRDLATPLDGLDAMVIVWLIFTAMLFVAEPMVLHRWFHERARADPEGTFALIERPHRILLTLSLVTVLGAVAGSHGLSLFE